MAEVGGLAELTRRSFMEEKKGGFAVTRRGFLGTLGAGAVAAVATTSGLAAGAAKESAVIDPAEMTKIALRINGKVHRVLVEPRWSLLFVLREVIGLTAAKEGCGRGECGACTVLIDNVPRYACLTLAVEAESTEIVTPEGLMEGESLGVVQQAFLEHDAFQCGYCTPGQVMAVEGLLRSRPAPSMEEIRTGVSGNLCRCGAYAHIFEAAKRAAELKRGRR
jgi:xanthine dehydrogenase YagT iron-sulfur-binding subunit